MERIGIRELRQHASRYIERVKAGETVEVTDRGRLVALLVPPTKQPSTFDKLVAEGKIIPAENPGPWVFPDRITAALTTQEIIDEDRGDR